MDPLTVSVADAIEATGLSRSHLYEEMAAGRLKSIKAGARRLIPTVALREYIALLTAESTGEA